MLRRILSLCGIDAVLCDMGKTDEWYAETTKFWLPAV